MSEPNLSLFDAAEIHALESESHERKESWNDDCLKVLAALANTRGGTLWLGVRDDGTVAGWNGDGKKQEAISNQIVDQLHIHPASMSIEDKDGISVLAIRMNDAASPVALRGRYYRRVGNSTRDIPPEELPRFLLERTGQTWDGLLADETIDSLTPQTIDDFRLLAKERLPELSPSDSIDSLLMKLKLKVSSNKVRRAAILLFGSDPQRLAPTAQVQIGRFKDDETILDDKRIGGNLFQQVRQVEQILRNIIFIRYEFPSRREGSEGATRRTSARDLDGLVENELMERTTSSGRTVKYVLSQRVVLNRTNGTLNET